MGFMEDIKGFADRIGGLKHNIATEEATKMSLVVPLFNLLGYDVFNPSEFYPEYTADFGIKKGEKVDYAIFINGAPEILIECKWCGTTLDKHGSQLFRYFGTTPAKFGILTNGIIYKFFTDLDEPNKMDIIPFLEINMLDLKESQINELRKFCKENFDKENILSTASELKYSNLMKDVFKRELENPSDDFIRFVLSNVYEAPKTQKVIDKFAPVVKKSFIGFINETVNQKITSALILPSVEVDVDTLPVEVPVESKITTTQDELDAFYVIRAILVGILDVKDIVHRDTESYFGILFKDNNRKPICRINFDTKKLQLLLPDENKTFTRYYIDSVSDIYKYKDNLIEIAKRYIDDKE